MICCPFIWQCLKSIDLQCIFVHHITSKLYWCDHAKYFHEGKVQISKLYLIIEIHIGTQQAHLSKVNQILSILFLCSINFRSNEIDHRDYIIIYWSHPQLLTHEQSP